MIERALKYIENEKPSQIHIVIGSPSPDGDDFKCRVTIDGAEFKVDKEISGVDSMQAVLLSLNFVKTLITSSEAWKAGKAYWLDPESGIGL